MKTSLKVGASASVTVDITPAMRPAFDGAIVHDVCSTWDLARHMETAARRVLVPHLDDNEEGIGSHLSIDHLAPAPVGSTIEVRANATEVDDSVLVCQVSAHEGDTVLATGKQVQRILPRPALADIMRRARARSGASGP